MLGRCTRGDSMISSDTTDAGGDDVVDAAINLLHFSKGSLK